MLIAVYLALGLIPMWRKETVRNILINVVYLGAATVLAAALFLALMPVFWAWWRNVVVLLGFVIILFQLPVWKIDRAAKPLALAGCVLLIGMTLASPALWRKFPAPLNIMIKTRENMIGGQIGHLQLDAAKSRFVFLLKDTFFSKVMYWEASSFDVPPVHEQIVVYENSPVSGRTGSWAADGLVAILAAIGGWALLRRFNAESLLIYSLFITSGVLLFVMVPLYWKRFYLIMQIPYSILTGAGASQIWGKSINSRSIGKIK
jgi:hypothetical protein